MIPDLAGIGNLILTPEARIKLVDINNVTSVDYGPEIYLDDRGYPATDKSVEVLALLEREMLGRTLPLDNRLYAHFLDPQRRREVTRLERVFRRRQSSVRP